MKKKPVVRKSKEVMDFIIDTMCEELLLVEQVCKKYPLKTPHPRNVYLWASEDADFGERINHAYTVWLMSKIEELEYISTTDSKLLFPEIEDFRERSEARRCRIDTLKFSLGKMAPILSKRFSVKQEVHHSGDAGIVFNIVDYSKE